MSTSSSQPSLLELVQEATLGFDELLNNDLNAAKATFSAREGSSVPHSVGAGMAAFLQAALGQEDRQLSGALDTLIQAEALAIASKTPQGATSKVYPHLEYKILTHDAVLGQALCHVLTESYVEFMKAVYKMSRAYKGFQQTCKVVFPGGVHETDSLDTIFTKLNDNYKKKTSEEAPTSSVSNSLFGWGRKKSAATELKHSNSSAALPSLNRLQLDDRSASEPVSKNVSPSGSTMDLSESPTQTDRGHPSPLWQNDPLTTLVISGSAFGFGLFGLVLSLLPPKMRKLISWFGFSNSNRAVALKMLTISASTGNDVHGYFASLALLTFYGVILLLSGWQADERYLISQCSAVLERVIDRFPRGTLWRLNKAKLLRMQHDTQGAIEVIEEALSHGSSFREADSLLVFELGWLYLSDAQWVKCADAFERMCTLNSWSHSTYLAIAAGALIDMPREEQTPEIKERIRNLLDKLPTLFGQKRLLGEPPTTELFIARRLEADKAKHARWVASGRLPKDSHPSEAMRITYAYILGCFWATIGGRSPPLAIEKQIKHLTEMTPPVRFGPQAGTSATINAANDDLDTVEELAMRDLLLGALYRSQGTLESIKAARQFLLSVGEHKAEIVEERWTVPFSLYELAVCECKEADLEERAAATPLNDIQRKQLWSPRLKKAEQLLGQVLTHLEYDLKSRLESRVVMLRDEIATKSKSLGLS